MEKYSRQVVVLSGNILDTVAIKQIVIGKVSMTNIVGYKKKSSDSSIDKMVGILHFLQLNPHSSTESISNACGMLSENVKKYMKRLSTMGLVMPEGGNRNRTYVVMLT